VTWTGRILAASLLAAASAAGCDNRASESAEVADVVVLYTSADQQFAQQIVKRFSETTGIEVRCRFDTEATKTLGLVQRLRSEADNPQADVFWSSEIFETIRLADEGFLAAHTSPITSNWPQDLRDGEGRWYGFARRARVLAYNTHRVSKAEVPKSIEELLAARWKGRVVMARPQFGTTRGHVGAMWVHYGPERARLLFEGLKENEVRLVNGNSTAVRMVAEGRADVCLTDTDDVWVAQRNSWPVDFVYPKHGQAGTLLIPNTVALVRGARHPQSAAKLIDYLLSREVEEALARSDSHNLPIRPELARQFARYAVSNPMQVDYVKVAAVLDDAVRSAVAVLGG
jgi:iron(III) transport system substrate-binding protein